MLIIQKKFDGFDETKERLDLLALDKEGRLVVIENKLDDSGRNVVWQALKYTAYASGLNRKQIVDIFQEYLNRYCGGGSAEEQICEFFEVEELEEAVLNLGNDQRMIFVAAKFQREVTTTALWLLGHKIGIKCFRAIPYVHGDEVFLDLQQIIPVPEAADYMINLASKEEEENVIADTKRRYQSMCMDFWRQVLQRFQDDGVRLFDNISPPKNNYAYTGAGLRSCHFDMVLGRSEVRVQVSLVSSIKEENKALFDQFYERRSEFEAAFGHPIVWRRMDNNKQTRIVYAKDFGGIDREHWPEMAVWLSEHIVKLERAFREPLKHIGATIPKFDEDEV